MENFADALLAPGDEVPCEIPIDAVAGILVAEAPDEADEAIAEVARRLRAVYRGDVLRLAREAAARFGERDALVALLIHLGFARREVVAFLRAAGANGSAPATVAAAITRTWAAFPE